MDNDKDAVIAEIAAQWGTTDLESQAIYHLQQAHELLAYLIEDRDRLADSVTVTQSMDALYRFVGQQVLDRDYPLGWAVPWGPLYDGMYDAQDTEEGEEQQHEEEREATETQGSKITALGIVLNELMKSRNIRSQEELAKRLRNVGLREALRQQSISNYRVGKSKPIDIPGFCRSLDKVFHLTKEEKICVAWALTWEG